MNKYEEALKFISKYNPSKEYVDACDTLKEAVEKANKYESLKDGIKVLNMNKNYCDVIRFKTYKGDPINEDSIEWVITGNIDKIKAMLEVVENEK